MTTEESEFGLLVESVVDYAIFLLDTNGVIRSWNAGAERLKGYSRDEIVGCHYSIFYPDELRAQELPARLLAKAKREGRARHTGWRVRKDGSRFWADVTITALRLPDGDLRGFAKVTRDMTDAHEAQEAREAALRDQERAVARLEELDQWRREFISAITHDLQTPVTAIAGFADILQDGRSDPDEARYLVGRIASNAATLQSLINHLRMSLSLEAGQIELELEPISLAAFVPELVADMEPALGRHEVTVEVDGLKVEADRNGLERILRNLLENAARHTGNDHHIRVAATETGQDWVAIEVRDDGEGISDDLLPAIFERFQRGRRGGTGLGLAIVREYVELHGGEVGVASEPGGGACFRFTLPAAH